jgi:hypothetical protein
MARHLRQVTEKNMKRILVPLVSALFIVACNNDAENENTADSAAGNPATVQPPSEALPDTMQLVNDSVVVPDTNADADVKARVGNSDSIRRGGQK